MKIEAAVYAPWQRARSTAADLLRCTDGADCKKIAQTLDSRKAFVISHGKQWRIELAMLESHADAKGEGRLKERVLAALGDDTHPTTAVAAAILLEAVQGASSSHSLVLAWLVCSKT